ncbi:MAG: ABC transporter ATP-binding protein [Oscillospiraceae bacterium]|nr:ABC transporter ATP-binding protein [Oscillospiraceae bacterium]
MIKRLSRCIREYKWAAILSPLCMVGEVAMEVTIPLVMAALYDKGIVLQDMTVVVTKSVQLVICALASLCFGVASATFASKAATGFAKNLRHDMFHHVQSFSFSNIDRFSTASIVTRLTSDVANLQMSFQMMIRMAVRSPMMLILAMISAMGINVKLSLVFCAALPVLIVALVALVPKVFKIFDRVFRTYDRLNNVVQENIHGIRVVKSFVREDKEIEKFTDISGSIYADFCKAERIIALNNPIMQFCVYGCMLAISWLGANMVIASGNNPELGLTTGQLSSMFTYTTQILSSLMMFSMVFVMLTMSRAPLKRCYELLTEEPNLTSPESGSVMQVKDGSIDFENVGFRYSATAQHRALKEVSLHIPSGATVGILGGTGSSKTTLVQLIPRLYDVSEGVLKVGGVDVREYDLQVLRDEVSMVLQKNELFSGTIKENLRWGDPDATDEELIRACRLACAHDFIVGFPDGYDTHIEQGGTNVSGGQKQRLCIARALLKKPKILILDDSTSAVDTKTDAMIREAFATEIPDTTKLIIAQRVASVESADIILVMENGMVAAQGSHDELLKTCQIYREVYESQTKGGDEECHL